MNFEEALVKVLKPPISNRRDYYAEIVFSYFYVESFDGKSSLFSALFRVASAQKYEEKPKTIIEY